MLPLICAAAALTWAGTAAGQGFSKADATISMDDGVAIASTLYIPSGTPPVGGWPAVMVMHGMGETLYEEVVGPAGPTTVAVTAVRANAFLMAARF